MRISWIITLPGVLSVVSALAIQKRDADFFSVRTKMHKDMSGRRGDDPNKYFHESVFHPHYDGRFADKELGYRERRQALSNLIQTYLATFADIGVETWLMHGTLLGWWWNRKILPWDSDSDVQVSEASMHYLASYYNMTVFHYKTPRIPEGRDYMLEVNPNYINREQSDKLNVIDARWVDTTSGLFIDITTARYNYTHPAGEGMLSCKDGHEYRDTYIFPLRDTFFEGSPAKIPFAYKEVLEAEYHAKALTLTEFEGHHFDDNKLEWVPILREVQKPIEAPKPVEAPKPAEGSKLAEAPKPEPKVEQKKPEEVKKDGEATKQDNTGKEPKNTPPISEQPAKQDKQQAHDSSERSPAQREADNKILMAAEKEQESVQTAEEIRKENELKAAEAKKKAEEKMKGEREIAE